MKDSKRGFAVHLGKAQIDAMFTRQAAAPIDDSEFLPLLEVMLTAYEKILPDTVADELWEYAFGVYDRLCREAQPAWSAADSGKLMRRYLLGDAGTKRRHRRQQKPSLQAKTKPEPENLGVVRWIFGPDVPTEDFFEGCSLDDIHGVAQAVDSFVLWMEQDRFLLWEAVACREQGIPLTERQQAALTTLWDFDDETGEPVLFIDEVPRFSQTWHAILNEIAPRLLVEPYRTFDIHNDVVCDGWTRIVTALREHGEGLSLPAGAESPEAVVPVEVRHKLRLQACFDSLSGLGQDESLTLEDPEQQYRIESFIECLHDCRDSVAFFALTLESLCARLILPTRDQLLFTQLMKQSLGLRLDREPIAGVL